VPPRRPIIPALPTFNSEDELHVGSSTTVPPHRPIIPALPTFNSQEELHVGSSTTVPPRCPIIPALPTFNSEEELHVGSSTTVPPRRPIIPALPTFNSEDELHVGSSQHRRRGTAIRSLVGLGDVRNYQSSILHDDVAGQFVIHLGPHQCCSRVVWKHHHRRTSLTAAAFERIYLRLCKSIFFTAWVLCRASY